MVSPPDSITQVFDASAITSKRLKLYVQPTPAGDRESFDHYDLARGVYVIIPIFGRWIGVKGNFLLRVYTDSDSQMKELIRLTDK